MNKNNADDTSPALTRAELTELFQALTEHIDGRFADVDLNIRRVGDDLRQRLDRVELKFSGLPGRVEILEDQVRALQAKFTV